MAGHPELSASEAADRLAVRELFDAFAHCADRRDAEGQKALRRDAGVRAANRSSLAYIVTTTPCREYLAMANISWTDEAVRQPAGDQPEP